MTRIADLVLSGVKDAAPALTASLRNSARAAGWTERAVEGLRIEPSGDELALKGDPQSEAEEYGNTDDRPNPAVRKWVSDEGDITRLLLAAVAERVKGVLR